MPGRVRIWFGLAGVVVASAAFRYALGRDIAAPWIMVDELIYSELAKSFADSGEFLLRGEPAGGAYGIVYPLLISPAYALFAAVPDAYAAAKAVNAVVMSLAAVPAYLIARRVLSPGLALSAAAFALAIPSLAYTGTLMTENAFYPVFLLVVLALVAYLDRPTWVGAVLLLAAAGLALLTRAQGIALVPAIATAPLLLARARGPQRYRHLYAVVGAALAAALAVQGARGRSLLDLMGAYRPVAERRYDAVDIARWLLYHVAELDLYVGVVPAAALLLLAGRARRLSPEARTFLAAAGAVGFWLLLATAAFASEIPVPARVMERNVFYLAPLLLIALLIWVQLGLPRPRLRIALPAVLTAGVLPTVLPFERLIGPTAVADAPALLPWWRLADAGLGVDRLWPVALVAGAAAATLALAVPRRYGLLIPALLVGYFALVIGVVHRPPHGFATTSANALRAGIGASVPIDWIDRAVDAPVAAVWSGHASPYTVWENEFFNRRVGAVYRLAGGLPGALPERVPGGERIAYAVSDGTAAVAGRAVAEDRATGLTLYRVDAPLRIVTRVSGLYPDDSWSGPAVTYTRTACGGGRLTVLVASDAALLGRRQVVSARSGSGAVRVELGPGQARELALPLTSRNGRCRAVFSVSPTAVPAQVTGGASADRRTLGVHFLRFTYRPPA